MERGPPPAVQAALATLAAAIGLLAWLTAAAARAGGGPGWPRVVFAVAVAVLLLGGLATRQRLAWLWGHALSLFLALLQGVALGVGLWRQRSFPLPQALASGGVVLCLLAAWWALGRPAAIAWFRLRCPACGKESRLGADFLFRRARCRSCGNVW